MASDASPAFLAPESTTFLYRADGSLSAAGFLYVYKYPSSVRPSYVVIVTFSCSYAPWYSN